MSSLLCEDNQQHHQTFAVMQNCAHRWWLDIVVKDTKIRNIYIEDQPTLQHGITSNTAVNIPSSSSQNKLFGVVTQNSPSSEALLHRPKDHETTKRSKSNLFHSCVCNHQQRCIRNSCMQVYQRETLSQQAKKIWRGQNQTQVACWRSMLLIFPPSSKRGGEKYSWINDWMIN